MNPQVYCSVYIVLHILSAHMLGVAIQKFPVRYQKNLSI